MKATHVANPVRVEAHRIAKILGMGKASSSMFVELEDGSDVELTLDMLARYVPKVGDYLVTQEDGYKYVNPREVFERKYNAIGQRVTFAQDQKAAAFLRQVADQVEHYGLEAELGAVVVGEYGARVHVFTMNSGLECVATLRIGEQIMLDTIKPTPGTIESNL